MWHNIEFNGCRNGAEEKNNQRPLAALETVPSTSTLPVDLGIHFTIPASVSAVSFPLCSPLDPTENVIKSYWHSVRTTSVADWV